ncbi:MAG: hypothetical protein H6945_06245 [Zoogloeaceae bacterium]|nr:hypothetical protein [Rhodocyclaceae bacterium]MCP5235323.1 hypothetical protein [Zoogloeaceae bacterium]
MSDPSDDAFIRRAGASLERSVDALDARTRSQLVAVRHRALSGKRRSGWRRPIVLAPAAALAVAVMLAVGVLLRDGDPALDPLPPLAETELELLELLAVQDPDELADDPDFYLWVEEALSTEERVDAG